MLFRSWGRIWNCGPIGSFTNDSLHLEEVFQKSSLTASPSSSPSDKGLTAGQKAALSRKTGIYTVEQHFKDKPDPIKELAQSVRDFLVDLDSAVEEVPKKCYIAYKISQNFVCMEIHKAKVLLYVKLDPKTLDSPKNARDVTNIGHYGTGNLELSVKNQSDLEIVKPLLEQAYQKVGG